MNTKMKIGQAAHILGVCTATLKKWHKEGKGPLVEVNALTGHRTYNEQDVRDYLAGKNFHGRANGK